MDSKRLLKVIVTYDISDVGAIAIDEFLERFVNERKVCVTESLTSDPRYRGVTVQACEEIDI